MPPDERLAFRSWTIVSGGVVSDLDTMYLNAEAIADIERLGISLVEGAPLRMSPEPTSRSLVLCGRRLV